MKMKILFTVVALLVSINAKASLHINCKTNQSNVTTEIQLQGASSSVFVKKDGELAYFNYLTYSYSEVWKSITLVATQSNGQELNGVKIYFDFNNGKTSSAAIRPYGLLTNRLFPGSEGITLVGMTCDQSYEAIKNEVNSL
jgi:hypothetical protein